MPSAAIPAEKVTFSALEHLFLMVSRDEMEIRKTHQEFFPEAASTLESSTLGESNLVRQLPGLCSRFFFLFSACESDATCESGHDTHLALEGDSRTLCTIHRDPRRACLAELG